MLRNSEKSSNMTKIWQKLKNSNPFLHCNADIVYTNPGFGHVSGINSGSITLAISICRYWQAKCNGVTPLAFLKQGVHPRSNNVTATFLFPYRHALERKKNHFWLKIKFIRFKLFIFLLFTYAIKFPVMFHVSKSSILANHLKS